MACRLLLCRAHVVAGQSRRRSPAYTVSDYPSQSVVRVRSGLSTQCQPALSAASEPACASDSLRQPTLAQPAGTMAALADSITSQLASAQAVSGTQLVPRKLSDAVVLFVTHKTPATIISGITLLTAWRVQLPFQWDDITVAVLVVAWWLVQEWLVHAKLLHSAFAWFGKEIHEGHHKQPYFHVSIDGLNLILPAMLVSFGLFWTAFSGSPTAITATIAYYCMGLVYQWTHFLVHTKVVPRSGVAKAIRRHHMLHHMRNEEYWLAFTLPAVDKLFNTAPEPASVDVTPLARGRSGC